MALYLLKRLLLFLPTLIAVVLITFFLGKMAPGDPVEQFLETSWSDNDYAREARRLGLDKPVFYFTVTTAAFPDTLYRYIQPSQKETVARLTAAAGNWERVEEYYSNVWNYYHAFRDIPDSLRSDSFHELLSISRSLRYSTEIEIIRERIDKSEMLLTRDSVLTDKDILRTSFTHLRGSFDLLVKEATPGKMRIPKFIWFGWDNQFHNWLTGLLRWDFGISYSDGRPVSSRIGDALYWTLVMNITAIILAFLISIPLGVKSAVHQGSRFDRWVTMGSFMLFSLPVFWSATMLLVFLTTPEYGLDWFPSIGLGNLRAEAPFWDRVIERTSHLVLPVFCLTYTSIAFITRQMRGSMKRELSMDYIRTAKAKGLSRKTIVWKHAFRNAIFPIITLFASVLPASIAGSVAVEVVFNIPGMGKLLVDAILQRDFPVVYAVMLLGAVLTVAGMLLADILYALFDPRVRFGK